MFKPKQRYVQPNQDPVFLGWSQAEREFMRGEAHTDLATRIGPVFSPAFDLFETADQYTLLGDLPGLGLKDLDIEVTGDSLTVIGERDGDEAAQDAACHALERNFGSFVRRFELRDRVDAGRSRTRMVNGVLMVEVPKRREAGPRS